MKDKLYKMMNWPEIEAIVYGDLGAPQTILGRHNVSNYTLYQTFRPEAKEVTLVIEGDKKKYPMEMVDEAGFFAVALLGKNNTKAYSYLITDKDDKKYTAYDPYIYDTSMNKEDLAKWNKGIAYHSYEFMGSHLTEIDGVKGCMFRVWAPSAVRVSVVGDFNGYNGKTHPMIFDEKSSTFGLFIPGIAENDTYKYEINAKGGRVFTKLDPYALKNTDSDSPVSVVCAPQEYKWENDAKVKAVSSIDIKNGNISIFETDNDYFRNRPEGLKDKDISDLCEYVSDMGYTHVLVNIQHEDYFYEADDTVDASAFKKLVDSMHKNGIGVLCKWSPAFFNPGPLGLDGFDGSCLYEYEDERRRFNSFFGYNFDYSKPAVMNYLLSNAFFLCEEYHIDGLHFDEISTILYLDYGRNEGEWYPNMYGGRENLEAVEFVKHLNSIIHKYYPGFLMSTKETSMFPLVTGDLKNEGLGFDLIWDNGLTEDYLAFVRRQGASLNLLTDNMAYAYSENYVNTISKEDVLAANDFEMDRLLDGAGFYDYVAFEDKDKPKVKRATNAFYMARPGKKLFFMGQDDMKLMPELNRIYKKYPAFHELDRNSDGFKWIRAIDKNDGILAFLRRNGEFDKDVLVVCNFSLTGYEEFKFGMPYEGKYKAFMNSEEARFGGEYKLPAKAVDTEDVEYDGFDCTLSLPLPPMSVTYYSYSPYSEEEMLKRAQVKADKIKAELKAEAEKIVREMEAEGLKREKELLERARLKAKELKKVSKKK